ncbi:MAG: hypothetical protein CMI09_08960 [Oceanospirillaceae bacterium]|nr:hypothetical protein [Oceanospirillaceae bacterium]
MEFLIEYGPTGLFIAAFLAATLLPLGSEAILVALLLNGLDPTGLVLIATAGNVLGSCTNYALGYWGGRPLIQRVIKTTDEELHKAEQRFSRWGQASMLLAWVPVIGDPLTLIAGILRINLAMFLLLVTLGKLGRYWVIAAMAV